MINQQKRYPPQPERIIAGNRNSSIELYRIIATFAVLIVHFNGWFVGGVPEQYDFNNPSWYRTGQMFFSAATVICVNMFVLISGYFGIRLKKISIIKLCIYLALIYIPFYILRSVYTHDFSMSAFVGKFFVISNAGYFIQCYFMLMFLSPLLNSFVEKYDKQCLKWVIFFVALEFWFGCIMNVEEFGYNHGYSVIHFVLIYMIGRCIKIFEEDLKKIKRKYWVLGYFLSTVIIVISYLIGIKWCWDYSSPFVIISSVCTFVPFIYKTYYNRFVNWISGGTLAVYIIQVTNPVYHILKVTDNYFLNTYCYPVYLFFILIVILLTFTASILYGKCCNVVILPIIKIGGKIKGKFEF